MILVGDDDIILAITHLINCIIADNKIPDDWCLSYIINCYKGKEDALPRGNYRGLKLLDQVMKVKWKYGTYTCNHRENSS